MSTVPSSTQRVRVGVYAVNIGFGNFSQLKDHHLGQFIHFAYLRSFSSPLVKFGVQALCRDHNGDDPWFAQILVEVMCFGA